MEMVILDENQKVLDKFNLDKSNKKYSLKKVDNIIDLDKRAKKFINALDYYTISAYVPTDNNDDFYVSYIDDLTLDSSYYNLEDIRGVCVSTIFSEYDKNKFIFKKMKEAYYNNQPQKLYFDYYNENVFYKRINITFTRINNYLYVLGRDETEHIVLSMERDNLFENEFNAIAIIQDYHFVKVNKKYLELFKKNRYEDVIGQKIGYIGLDPNKIKELNEDFEKIITQQLSSYSVSPIEIKDNDKLIHYFKIKGDYIIHNHKAAVMIQYDDIVEEELKKRKLEVTLKDKEILLSEVHHRVKNNLQIVLSLINLNKNYDKDTELILDDTESRIYAMALIHEKIYGSNSLSEVNIEDYVNSLVTSLLETYESDIQFNSNMESIDLDMEEAIPLGLIINELVINVIKYAFVDTKEGNLFIELEETDGHCILIVKDDGVGLPIGFKLDEVTSLGLIVVQNLVQQIEGTISILDCNGTGFKIEFEK